MLNLGNVAEDATVYVPWNTTNAEGGPEAPSSAFVVGDIAIYKDGSATEKTSTNGLTIASPFDAKVGAHLLTIDTSNDTGDAGFWVAGADYLVVLSTTKTVDGQSVDGVWLAMFSIENRYMRGTDSAAPASVLGALDDGAAAGDPTNADTAMQYLKQLVNVLVGTAGVNVYPAEAAPANAVSLAEVIRAIHDDVTGLNGDAMRGTDGANTQTPLTAAQVNAEVDTALADYDPPTNAEMEARTLAAASYATATNQTTILNRLGDFAGSGLNTIKGFFQALFRKDAGVSGVNLPSEINEAENGTAGAYDATTDSQEAIRDTAPLGTAMRGTDGANTTTPPTSAAIADQVWDEAKADHVGAGSFGEEMQDHALSSEISALNDLSAADVNAQVDAALDTAIPGTPTANSINERIKALDDLLQAAGSGDAAAIKTAADAIKAVTDNLPNSGSLNDLATLASRLTAARAGYLDKLNITGNVAGATPLATVDTVVDAIKGVTDALPDAGALSDLATIKAYLDTTTIAERTVGAPPATPAGLLEAGMYLYQQWRNGCEQTSTKRRLKNDAGTVVAESTMSDDGATFDQGKMGAPP